MVLFNNIPYKRMRLTSKVNLTKRFSKKYKHMRLTTRLYGITFLNFKLSNVKLMAINLWEGHAIVRFFILTCFSGKP